MKFVAKTNGTNSSQNTMQLKMTGEKKIDLEINLVMPLNECH